MPAPTSAALRTDDNRLRSLIRERAASLGAKTYLEHARGDRALSYGELEAAVADWAARFAAAGTGPGSTVGLVITDPVELSTAFLAVIASGRWAAALDPATPVRGVSGLAAALTRVGADVVFADDPVPAGVDVPWVDIRRQPRPSRSAPLPPPPAGGAVLASSGTTGVPKVIALHEDQLLHTARSVADHHRFTAEDRGFNCLPLFHINAQVVGLLACLVSGATLVLDDRFHRTQFWKVMAACGITWINAVPAIISRLSELEPDEAVPATIRFIRSASAPLPTATLGRFEATTGIAVLETYGMTEAASQITANPLDGVRKPGSVGHPVGMELRIVPDEEAHRGVPVPPGTMGHVEIRGPSVITSYGGGLHPDRFDAEGWLRTGDLGHFDQEGFLFLDARSDDVINRGGEKVLPREIEELALGEPDIASISVVGESDPVFGQVPVAYLVVRGVVDASGRRRAGDVVDRLRLHLESTLVRSKRPVSLRVVRELPAGATGKVQRRTLREQTVPVLYQLECR